MLQAEMEAIGWYTMYVVTHGASGMKQLRALAKENDGIATQLGATDDVIDVCERPLGKS